MNFDNLHNYCMSKAGATKDFPFDETTLVFRVMRKIFALTGIDNDPLWVNLKCEPVLAEALRDEWDAVRPGYHMNKKHWNTVVFDGSIPEAELKKMIDHSYDRVVRSLKKADREALKKRKQ